VLLGLLVLKVLLATQEFKATPARLVLRVPPASLVLPDHKVRPALQALLDPRGLLALQVLPVPRALRALLVLVVLKALQVSQAQLALKVQLATREFKATPARQVPKGQPASLVLPDHKERPE